MAGEQTALSDLQDDERAVLLGLVMTLVDADEERSIEEIAALKHLGVLLGRERFLEGAKEARRRFPTRGSLLAALVAVERPAARHAIFDVLRDLAMRDGLVAEEAELLGWLASTWNIDWRSDPVEL